MPSGRLRGCRAEPRSPSACQTFLVEALSNLTRITHHLGRTTSATTLLVCFGTSGVIRNERRWQAVLTVKQALESIPVPINERRFRAALRELGLNLMDNRAMMVRAGDIDTVLEHLTERPDWQKRQLERTAATGKRNGSLASISLEQLQAMIEDDKRERKREQQIKRDKWKEEKRQMREEAKALKLKGVQP